MMSSEVMHAVAAHRPDQKGSQACGRPGEATASRKATTLKNDVNAKGCAETPFCCTRTFNPTSSAIIAVAGTSHVVPRKRVYVNSEITALAASVRIAEKA